MRTSALWACLAIAATIVALPARAAETAAFIAVRAEVVADCRIASADLSFGSYDPLSVNAREPLDGNGELRVACTKMVQANITLDGGRRGTPEKRLMIGPSANDRLSYQIYRDSDRSSIWGIGTTGISFVGSGPDAAHIPVYARIPAGQDVVAGTYSDVVTTRVEF